MYGLSNMNTISHTIDTLLIGPGILDKFAFLLSFTPSYERLQKFNSYGIYIYIEFS